MRKCFRGVLSIALVGGAAGLFLLGCNPAGPITPKLVVTSVKEGAVVSHGLSRGVQPTFTHPASGGEAPDFEISGPPDYLKVTLKKITLLMDSGAADPVQYVAWEGSQTLTIDGAGTVDASGISLDVPACTLTGVRLTFASVAQVKGSILSQNMRTDTSGGTGLVSAYTTASLAWNPVTKSGGAPNFTDYNTGTAQEMDIYLQVTTSDFDVDTPSSAIISAGDSPTLTILFDLSRVLRFYNGKRGTDGADNIGTTNAFFYAFSVFPQSVATFIGDAGTIQGYEAHFNGYELNGGDTSNPHAVPGWMTLIYDPQGNFLSGMMIGDSDTSWTVCKGGIATYTEAGGLADMTYSVNTQSNNTLSSFQKQTVLDEYTPLATWNIPSLSWYGEAYFRLKLQE
jgi:hypothetical protein